jgi:regulator of sigma E protease
MVVLIKTLQVILALSILIIIHELGHFTFSKIFGIRVDKFFLFFDAWGVKLFSTKETRWFTKLFPKMKDAETEYGIGWLPLGGYCKINGMVDESLDMKSLKEAPKEWEFRSKPAWQRLLVMFGGVLYNFIFAILVYIVMFAIWGDTYLSNKDNKIYVNSLAYDMGFRTGDKILKFDDYEPQDFSMLQADLARRSVKKATILRGSDTLDLYIDRTMIGQVLKSPDMFTLAVPFIVDSVMTGSVNSQLETWGQDRSNRLSGGILCPRFQKTSGSA